MPGEEVRSSLPSKIFLTLNNIKTTYNMIDTIKLILFTIHISNLDQLIAHLLSTLDDINEIRNLKNEKVYKGNFKNLRVSVSSGCIMIEGSVLKYWKGSNQLNWRASEFLEALTDIGEKLQIPIFLARVVRLDLGVNVTFLRPELEYYDALGYLKNFNRHQQKYGLNYQNVAKSGKWYISIYEKLKNIRSPEKVTKLFQDQYVLRLEFRFQKVSDLEVFLDVPFVSPVEIYNGYSRLIKKWEDVFLSIEKKSDLIEFAPKAFTQRGALDNQMKLMGLKALGGIGALERMLNKAKKSKVFTHPNQSSNILLRYRKLTQTPDMTIKTALAVEFDRKVRLMAELMMNEQMEDKILEEEVGQK